MHAVDIDVVIADLGCDLTDDARLVFVLHRKHDWSDGKVCLISEEAYQNLSVFTDDRTGNRELTAFFCYEVYNDHASVALALCTLALNNFDTMGLDALTYIYEAYTSIGMCGEEALQNRKCQDTCLLLSKCASELDLDLLDRSLFCLIVDLTEFLCKISVRTDRRLPYRR